MKKKKDILLKQHLTSKASRLKVSFPCAIYMEVTHLLIGLILSGT